MIARVVRSGMTESVHDGVVAVVDTHGDVIASHGDIDHRFYARSAVKPFQASVSQRAGADLPPEWLAVACASHDGSPVHLAIVRSMLESAGLKPGELTCPPAWPSSPEGRTWLVRTGHTRPQRLFHNCSGKHAAFLRASRASDWGTSDVLDRDHPLQERVRMLVADVTGDGDPAVGIDGCGAPTFSVSALGLARAFSRLGNDSHFDDVFRVMHRYPRLVSGVGYPDAETAIVTHAAAKRGAEGNIGVAVRGRGGIAVKILDGSSRPIGPIVASVLERLGWTTPSMTSTLSAATAVPMSGGGRTVGSVEPLLDLVYA